LISKRFVDCVDPPTREEERLSNIAQLIDRTAYDRITKIYLVEVGVHPVPWDGTGLERFRGLKVVSILALDPEVDARLRITVPAWLRASWKLNTRNQPPKLYTQMAREKHTNTIRMGVWVAFATSTLNLGL
jgi:hypothetical protein